MNYNQKIKLDHELKEKPEPVNTEPDCVQWLRKRKPFLNMAYIEKHSGIPLTFLSQVLSKKRFINNYEVALRNFIEDFEKM